MRTISLYVALAALVATPSLAGGAPVPDVPSGLVALKGVNRISTLGSGSARVVLEEDAYLTFKRIVSEPYDFDVQTPGRFAYIFIQRVAPSWGSQDNGQLLVAQHVNRPKDCPADAREVLHECIHGTVVWPMVDLERDFLPDGLWGLTLDAGEFLIGIVADGHVPVSAEITFEDIEGNLDLELNDPAIGRGVWSYEKSLVSPFRSHSGKFYPHVASGPTISVMMAYSHGVDSKAGRGKSQACLEVGASATEQGHTHCSEDRHFGRAPHSQVEYVDSFDLDPGPIAGSWSVSDTPGPINRRTWATLVSWPWVAS